MFADSDSVLSACSLNNHLLGVFTVTYAEHFRILEQLLVDIQFNKANLLSLDQKWAYVVLKACAKGQINFN